MYFLVSRNVNTVNYGGLWTIASHGTDERKALEFEFGCKCNWVVIVWWKCHNDIKKPLYNVFGEITIQCTLYIRNGSIRFRTFCSLGDYENIRYKLKWYSLQTKMALLPNNNASILCIHIVGCSGWSTWRKPKDGYQPWRDAPGMPC